MKILLLLLLCAGCAHRPLKPCNLDRIAQEHADLSAALQEHQALVMDFMRTISILENQAGGYQ